MDNIIKQKKKIEIYVPILKVLGVGGAGCNAINRMIEYGYDGIEYISANTDAQALNKNVETEILLGRKLTRGMGAGGDPEVGYEAALESRADLEAALSGADIVFLTAGMGGGTGTGAIVVAAETARAMGATVIAIVTMPFSFEAGVRQKNALWGIEKLREHANTLITIPNDRILSMSPKDLPIDVAFRLADDVLRQAVQGLSELISDDGIINVNFAHVQHLLRQGGGAFMTVGQGSGENRMKKAIQQATNHPLLENISLEEASGMIISMKGGDDFSLFEVSEALSFLNENVKSEFDLIWGVTNDSHLIDTVQVIMVVTGIGALKQRDVFSKIAIKKPMNPEGSQELVVGDIPPFLEKRSGIPTILYENDTINHDEFLNGEIFVEELSALLVSKQTEMSSVSGKNKTIQQTIDLDLPSYLRVSLDGGEDFKRI